MSSRRRNFGRVKNTLVDPEEPGALETDQKRDHVHTY